MRTLEPVHVSEYYIKQIAKGMRQYFWGYIFAKIFEILEDNVIDNSQNDLKEALKSGRVWYEKGAFRTGNRFSNAVAKTLEEMGARHFRGAYYIELDKVPKEIITLMEYLKGQALVKTSAIEQYLAGLLPILDKLTVQDFIEIAVNNMFKKLETDIIQNAMKGQLPVIELGIATPKVQTSIRQRQNIEKYWKDRENETKKLQAEVKRATTPEAIDKAKKKLADFQKETYAKAPTLDVDIDQFELSKISEKVSKDYVYNMNYWVKKWEVKNIIEMRKEVADMVQKGKRIDEVAKYFEKRWKIAKNKAYFLAFNESHLASSVIEATQYQKLGCTQFEWGRSTAIEKRKLHKEYYGKIFSFDNPPIIDEELGIKGLPRQIWNCQCQIIPVVPTVAEIMKQKEQVKNAKWNIIGNNKQRNNTNWRYRRYGER